MAHELPPTVWTNAWTPRPREDDVNVWDPEHRFPILKKPKKKQPTMAAALAASDLPEQGDDEREDGDGTTMSNVLSQKRMNEPIKDVMDRIEARRKSAPVQFSLGINNPFTKRYLDTGGYLNPNAVTEIPEEFQAQYKNTPAQIAGTGFGLATQLAGPVGTIIHAPRTIAGAYNRYQMDADRQRLTATAGHGPVSAGFNAQYLSDLEVPDQYGADQLSLPTPPPPMLRINERNQAKADAVREEQAINEAIDNADTYGGHPADYY